MIYTLGMGNSNELNDSSSLKGLDVIPCWLVNLFPTFGFFAGLCMWFVDAWVDVNFIHLDEEFMEAVFSSDDTEIWMRSLVVIVMTVAAVIVQSILRKQRNIELQLRKYQHHLEDIVADRTKELEKIGSLDPLTQIYNRRKFLSVLEYELNRSIRYGHSLSLILCDLDHFKYVNDEYGHNQGDVVLQAFARLLPDNLRNVDFYARWGGEEFIILLPDTSEDCGEIVANKICLATSQLTFDSGIKITASFGISCLEKQEEGSLDLIKRADEALYQAKHNGRNCVKMNCRIVK